MRKPFRIFFTKAAILGVLHIIREALSRKLNNG
jgi:hypothetical protein